MRKKRLLLNTTTSWIYEVLAIISSLILPRLFLSNYGSEMNGLMQSITQFLSIISFLQFGIGAVIQASLYKPLVDKNNEEISKVIASGEKFFKKIGFVLLVYASGLMLFYPIITHGTYGFGDVLLLVFAISLGLFVQYYFGLVDILLLVADQKGYINYIGSIVTVVINTAVSALLICAGWSIQAVKIVSAVIFLIKPIFNRIYISQHYVINRKITYNTEPIKQKWNGVAQHVSTVVLDNTDTLVLTVFSTLSNVSIYGIYHMVIYGVKTMFTSVANGVEAVLGELWARNDKNELNKVFGFTEWGINNAVILLFGCTEMLIIPFVMLYTKGITDANYYQPLFATLMVIAHAFHCLRLPYHMMIKASGKFKETQNNYLIAAIINLLISMCAVKRWGLIGVAIGTLVAMVYQTVWMALFNVRHLGVMQINQFLKQMIFDLLAVVILTVIVNQLPLQFDTVFHWIFSAAIVFVVDVLVLIGLNLLFYKEKSILLIKKVKVRVQK